MSGGDRYWHEVDEDFLELEEAELIGGRDLWLCVEGDNGHRVVLRGYYLVGDREGFHLDHGVELGDRWVTHYWPRDYKPALPEY